MRLIAQNPEMSSRQLATKVKISNGSAYYVLTQLVEKGFVKLVNFKNNTRKGQYAYLLTPRGIREKSLLTHRFIERKRQEFMDLKVEIQMLEEEAGIIEEIGPSLEIKKNITNLDFITAFTSCNNTV